MGHWTLDDINWDAFEADAVDPDILAAVKAAAMVEYDAADYVTYLCNVFAEHPDIQETIRQWGAEEAQHGKALDEVGVNVNGLDLEGILAALPVDLLDNLGVANTAQLEDTLTQKESDWLDLFFAYAHNKRISFVIAYAILGDITLTPDQHGFYFSTHLTF